LKLYDIGNIETSGLEKLTNLRELTIINKVNLVDDILVNLTNLVYLNVGVNPNLIKKDL
jgi:hypothetical protein